MQRLFNLTVGVGLAAATLFVGSTAFAAPTLTIPVGARFLPGQRFDIRVENAVGTPALTVDGAALTYTAAANNGFYVRAYSNSTAGTHTLIATDSTGSSSVQFQVIPAAGSRRPSKNIIILLGDGMGVQHRTAARVVRYGLTAGHTNGYLAMDTMPGLGLVSTSSLNSLVTDSSPGMSCYVTGNKSNNNQEGVFPDGTADNFDNPRVEYLSEYLHRVQGKSLGIVTTADVEDATPAANAVHTANRNAGTGICDQYLDESSRTGLTVLLGGGRRWFLPAGQFGSSRDTATDYQLPAEEATAYGLTGVAGSNGGTIDPSRDLLSDFQSQGFTYVADRSSLLAGAGNATKLLGLFGYGNMNVAYDKLNKRRGVLPAGHGTYVVDDYMAPDQPMLDEMATAALSVLSKNKNGFVLMIEGAHIDKQTHLMDADRVNDETLEFDHAVKRCLDFADQAGDTTVIVTADHECGGFSILGSLSSLSTLQGLPSDAGITDPVTQPKRQTVIGSAFPAYQIFQADTASGPDAVYNGFPAVSDINGKILIGYGANGDRYEGWLSKPLLIIDSLLPTGIQSSLAGNGYVSSPKNRQAANPDGTGDSRGFFIRGQVGNDQAGHTGTDIPLTAYSSGSRVFQNFVGVQDNTDVFFKLAQAALGGY